MPVKQVQVQVPEDARHANPVPVIMQGNNTIDLGALATLAQTFLLSYKPPPGENPCPPVPSADLKNLGISGNHPAVMTDLPARPSEEAIYMFLDFENVCWKVKHPEGKYYNPPSEIGLAWFDPYEVYLRTGEEPREKGDSSLPGSPGDMAQSQAQAQADQFTAVIQGLVQVSEPLKREQPTFKYCNAGDWHALRLPMDDIAAILDKLREHMSAAISVELSPWRVFTKAPCSEDLANAQANQFTAVGARVRKELPSTPMLCLPVLLPEGVAFHLKRFLPYPHTRRSDVESKRCRSCRVETAPLFTNGESPEAPVGKLSSIGADRRRTGGMGGRESV
ncbi:hypothetical protein PG994_000676 [Apiospora phragmitis]|uniref:Uncharacterized protein n=1 Tax=Apiospora phragmitis TaxID=2905665 RepID=A0ABR1X707_9PEZI